LVRTEAVLGVLSQILWALMVIVTAKYVLILLHADNKGEDGILSLMALAQRAPARPEGSRILTRAHKLRRTPECTKDYDPQQRRISAWPQPQRGRKL
jgi:hypothetical protein